jgi:ADP-ribose pyrophosphatase YjhB (NUDIX family)
VTCAAVSLVRNPAGEVLCVWNQRYHGWTLPGGKLEHGESSESAQARELLEETGMRTVNSRRVYTRTHRTPTLPDHRIPSETVEVHVYIVQAEGDQREDDEPWEVEPGCPVAWLAQSVLLALSPFNAFYEGMFASLR